jgi:hypothetical protein
MSFIPLLPSNAFLATFTAVAMVHYIMSPCGTKSQMFLDLPYDDYNLGPQVLNLYLLQITCAQSDPLQTIVIRLQDKYFCHWGMVARTEKLQKLAFQLQGVYCRSILVKWGGVLGGVRVGAGAGAGWGGKGRGGGGGGKGEEGVGLSPVQAFEL